MYAVWHTHARRFQVVTPERAVEENSVGPSVYLLWESESGISPMDEGIIALTILLCAATLLAHWLSMFGRKRGQRGTAKEKEEEAVR